MLPLKECNIFDSQKSHGWYGGVRVWNSCPRLSLLNINSNLKILELSKHYELFFHFGRFLWRIIEHFVEFVCVTLMCILIMIAALLFLVFSLTHLWFSITIDVFVVAWIFYSFLIRLWKDTE